MCKNKFFLFLFYMSKIFCDVGEVPKTKKRGSMKECAEIGQIKYWGEKKIDKKMIELVVDGKKKKKSLSVMKKEYETLMIKSAGIAGKVKNLIRKIQSEKDEKKIKKLKAEKQKLEKQFTDMRQKAVAIKEKIAKEEKKNEEKKSSKKSSKKLSRNKKSSKKKSKKI